MRAALIMLVWATAVGTPAVVAHAQTARIELHAPSDTYAGLIAEAAQRFAGYRKGLDESGIPFDPALVVPSHYTRDDARKAVEELLASGVAFDAVFAFSDLLALAKNYGKPGTWSQGDFTGDGKVDFADLLTLAKNYNGALPADPLPGAPAAFSADLARAFAAVPEPSAGAVILTLGIATSLGRRRRRV